MNPTLNVTVEVGTRPGENATLAENYRVRASGADRHTNAGGRGRGGGGGRPAPLGSSGCPLHGASQANELKVVGVPGFEPGTSCSQSRRATKLRHTPYFPLGLLAPDGPATHCTVIVDFLTVALPDALHGCGHLVRVS